MKSFPGRVLARLYNAPVLRVHARFISTEDSSMGASGSPGPRRARKSVQGEYSDSAVSHQLQEQLDGLDLVPFGSKQNLTELEQQDLNIKKQLRLVKTAVRMKVPRPIAPSLRWYRWPQYPYLHKGGPVKALTVTRHPSSGRNNTGRIMIRHQGGGKQRRVRIVDMFRLAEGVNTVKRIEYDPNRSAHLALLENDQGALSYIPATVGMRAGDEVESFRQGVPQRITDAMGGSVDPGILAGLTAKRGNCLPLRMVPLGTVVHNIGMTKLGPAKFCRAAGTYGRLYEKIPERNRAVVRLQSGETRYVALDACATIGMVSNPDHQHRSFGKAGRSRNLGIRPTVRGGAMNKCDHPLGGGRGKSKGNKIPVSPWGVIAKNGFKTRRGKNVNRMVIRGRPRGSQGAN
ncbi:54S ribosomal protein RML2, mitochondrial [Wickerhamiella sorbophila]|uniref:54S ribosomal protein RML2, mitochondrial n=1 Tax=Wickerhamiella sorbophila TaxID=45607 RepID=A0A2T0FFW2_9ASCO|nr:54S ribosomal protein RML2, mitochondrial [Wickerhamiella sorbophila]PRT53875.1 54S ribosomal protein RML2, mitochondrial [Wickerhamiella sorbophila]